MGLGRGEEGKERGGTSGEGGGMWARSTGSVLSWSDGMSWRLEKRKLGKGVHEG